MAVQDNTPRRSTDTPRPMARCFEEEILKFPSELRLWEPTIRLVRARCIHAEKENTPEAEKALQEYLDSFKAYLDLLRKIDDQYYRWKESREEGRDHLAGYLMGSLFPLAIPLTVGYKAALGIPLRQKSTGRFEETLMEYGAALRRHVIPNALDSAMEWGMLKVPMTIRVRTWDAIRDLKR